MIGEILVNDLIVVLNKIDLLDATTRTDAIEKVLNSKKRVFYAHPAQCKSRLVKTFATTKFRSVTMIPLAARVGAQTLLF